MTNEQETMWRVLSNDAEFLCHKWAKEMLELKGRRFHTACDQHLKFVADNFGTDEAPRILMTWLKEYKLPIDPNKLSSFDDFHTKFGQYICDNLKSIKAYV
jgi:hypothetical protein